jgi:arylsulfatase
MDVAPTIFELAGARHPGTEYQGREVLPLRGKSMLPYLQGKAKQVRGKDDAVGWELGGRKALRKGDWKIVYANKPWGKAAGSSTTSPGPHRKPRPGRREPPSSAR